MSGLYEARGCIWSKELIDDAGISGIIASGGYITGP